jgi:hypothetical protein
MASVLYTGWDASLMETRTLLLETAGHEVQQARTEREVASSCGKQQFDVAVICQTVSLRMKRVIASVVREHCPEVKILELYSPHLGKALAEADSWLPVPANEPTELPKLVTELAEKPKGGA